MRQSTYARRVLGNARQAGWRIIGVDDGGDGLSGVTTIRGAMEVVCAVDFARVFLKHDASETRGWMLFVWQGPDQSYEDAAEILSDYTVNLQPVVDATDAMQTTGAR